VHHQSIGARAPAHPTTVTTPVGSAATTLVEQSLRVTVSSPSAATAVSSAVLTVQVMVSV
jgi:hypothetical protein